MKNIHQYYVYIITNKKDGVLYIGTTNDLQRRIIEHKEKLVNGFLSKYNLGKLIYFEEFQNVNDAILREKRLKKWNRDWKINLIESQNEEWLDLSKDWI